MAYVGQGIKNGTFTVLDTSGNTYNGSNTTFNLGTQVGAPAQLLVSHDGVIQKPVTDYTIATGGTQITFTTAPASGASIFITEISGAVGGPMNRDINGDELILDADADTSITADTDDQVDIRIAGNDDFKLTAKTLAIGGAAAADSKIVFDGNAQDYHIGLDDSADDLVIGLGSTLGTTTHMSFDETGAIIKPLQPAARVTLSGNLSVNHNTFTKVSFDTETYDKNGDFASNKFTAPVAGRYFIHCHAEIMDLADQKDFLVCIYKNGSITNSANEKSSSANYQTNSITDVLELAATDYIEFYVKHVHGSSRDIYAANTFGEVYLLG